MRAAEHAAGFELVTLKSSAVCVRSREHGEVFHPGIGPMAEASALHVQGQRLAERARRVAGRFVIWDVGLGAAANAVAAIEALRDVEAEIEMHSFDRSLEALEFAIAHDEALGYPARHRAALEQLLAEQGCEPIAGRGGFLWRAHVGDFRETLCDAPAPDAIFYDPYSPRANPELWTLEHFSRLHARLDAATPCLLTNYTRSTSVRVTLLLAGFHVGRGGATGEKNETTAAANAPELLAAPLGAGWLARVERSTRAAPLREEGTHRGPIAEADWQRILGHPQFAS